MSSLQKADKKRGCRSEFNQRPVTRRWPLPWNINNHSIEHVGQYSLKTIICFSFQSHNLLRWSIPWEAVLLPHEVGNGMVAVSRVPLRQEHRVGEADIAPSRHPLREECALFQNLLDINIEYKSVLVRLDHLQTDNLHLFFCNKRTNDSIHLHDEQTINGLRKIKAISDVD